MRFVWVSDQGPRYWTKPLSQRIKLKDGRELLTLADAADLLGTEFSAVTRSASLEHAIALLIQAAETGRPVERRAATEQVRTLLTLWHRLEE